MCCQELYVNEVSAHKVNMVLVNKADLLTKEQRRAWARHFQKQGLRAVFWSALAESERLDAEEKVNLRSCPSLGNLNICEYIYIHVLGANKSIYLHSLSMDVISS